MEYNDSERIGYKARAVTVSDTHFERKCCGCGEVAESETRRVDKVPNDRTILNEFDEFVRNLQRRGWNATPPLCKKCRINLIMQGVEDLLDAQHKPWAGEVL